MPGRSLPSAKPSFANRPPPDAFERTGAFAWSVGDQMPGPEFFELSAHLAGRPAIRRVAGSFVPAFAGQRKQTSMTKLLTLVRCSPRADLNRRKQTSDSLERPNPPSHRPWSRKPAPSRKRWFLGGRYRFSLCGPHRRLTAVSLIPHPWPSFISATRASASRHSNSHSRRNRNSSQCSGHMRSCRSALGEGHNRNSARNHSSGHSSAGGHS